MAEWRRGKSPEANHSPHLLWLLWVPKYLRTNVSITAQNVSLSALGQRQSAVLARADSGALTHVRAAVGGRRTGGTLGPTAARGGAAAVGVGAIDQPIAIFVQLIGTRELRGWRRTAVQRARALVLVRIAEAVAAGIGPAIHFAARAEFVALAQAIAAADRRARALGAGESVGGAARVRTA